MVEEAGFLTSQKMHVHVAILTEQLYWCWRKTQRTEKHFRITGNRDRRKKNRMGLAFGLKEVSPTLKCHTCWHGSLAVERGALNQCEGKCDLHRLVVPRPYSG